MQLGGVGPQAVLVAHVHRDRAVPPEVADVLIHEGERRVRGPLGEDVRLRCAILRRQVEIERRILRVGRPRRGRGQLRSGEERQARAVGRRLHARDGLLEVGARRPGSARRQAARAHDVQAAEHVGMLHADPGRSVASHRVADQAAARSIGDRPVVGVDVGDHVVRDEPLEVARGHRARVHGAVVRRLRVGQHDDHLPSALREGAFDRLRHVDLAGPLLGADGVAVQRIDDRVAPGLVRRIARRQEHDRVAVDGIPFQIALEGRRRGSSRAPPPRAWPRERPAAPRSAPAPEGAPEAKASARVIARSPRRRSHARPPVKRLPAPAPGFAPEGLTATWYCRL